MFQITRLFTRETLRNLSSPKKNIEALISTRGRLEFVPHFIFRASSASTAVIPGRPARGNIFLSGVDVKLVKESVLDGERCLHLQRAIPLLCIRRALPSALSLDRVSRERISERSQVPHEHTKLIFRERDFFAEI